MSTRPVVLGIDGGGTSTVALLADARGQVVGRGRAGPSNAKAVGEIAAREALDQAIAAAFDNAGHPPEPVEVACLGLAGFDRPEDRRLLAAWSDQARWASRLVLANDGELVVAAGTPEGWGVGLIAGTGSIAVGRSPGGQTARAGGWGYLIGDEGSAYAVALAGLRLVARRTDGRDRSRPASGDPLTEGLCRALGIAGPGELVCRVYAADVDRTRIAALAPAVVEAAKDDPIVEWEILEPAGRALAEMVVSVADALDLEEAGETDILPLALAGGFLLSAQPVADALLKSLEDDGFHVRPERVPEPARGAIVLARRALTP